MLNGSGPTINVSPSASIAFRRGQSHRGAVAVIAMIFLVLTATLGTVIYATTTVSTRTSYSFADADRARVAAESGMRWFSGRMRTMAMPEPLRGQIGGAYAWDALWNDPALGVATAIKANLDSTILATSSEKVSIVEHTLTTPRIAMDTLAIGEKFSIELVQDPSVTQRFYVTSTGYFRDAVRRVRMEFWLDKKIPYAVVGRVPIQIGKNVLVRGPVAMTSRNYKNQPGVLCLSDFKYTPGLEPEFQAFQDFLRTNYSKRDNSIDVVDAKNKDLVSMAASRGWHDLNGDNRLNEYDVFLKQFAGSYADNPFSGPQITSELWERYISPQDLSLFTAIDHLRLPLDVILRQTKGQWELVPRIPAGNQIGFADEIVNNVDNYAKIYGQLKLLSQDGFDQRLLQGPIISPDADRPAVSIADSEEEEKMFKKLVPSAFTGTCNDLRAKTGPTAGTTDVHKGRIENKIIALEDLAQNNSPAPTRALGAHELVEVNNPGNAYLLQGKARVALQRGQALTPQELDQANANPGVTIRATTMLALMAVMDPGDAYLLNGSTRVRLAFLQALTPQELAQANANIGVTRKATAVPYANVWATERTPWGSTSSQAIYKRPVFSNIQFQNCRIPKGLNALFIDCTFKGVTFVETEPVTGRASASDAWNWIDLRTDGVSGMADRSKQVFLPSDSFAGSPGSLDASTQVRTNGSELGNNIRFDGCTFEGPLAGNVVDVYTHCANSWEFNGNSVINNTFDDTVTVCSPQVNIEMGSYEVGKINTILMKGVVVVGNFDARGQGCIDGSIIVTGDGAGNTTLGYFGPSDSIGSNFDPADVVARSGYLILRYNPMRALPDGVKVPVDLTPDQTTYREVL